MEYISAEEFLKQPNEVQMILKEWWEPKIYDLFFRDFGNAKNSFMRGIYDSCIEDYGTMESAIKDKSFMPLLTEGQLRKFIEDYYKNKNVGIYYETYKTKTNELIIQLDSYYDTHGDLRPSLEFISKNNNLLKAYWDVVCQIIKKGLNYE